jgi:hypothetical protein
MEFKPPFNDGMNASVVFGQVDFTSNSSATSQSGFNDPTGVALDAAGELFVVDLGGSRVLEFQPPFITGMPASFVIGQPDFTSSGGATSQSGLSGPFGAATVP